MAINNAALLGIGVLAGGGGMLIYRGLIEDHRTNSERYISGMLGDRFTITTGDDQFDKKVEEYKRPERAYLRISGLGQEQAGTATSGTQGNGSNQGNQRQTTITITRDELRKKCKSMLTEDVRDGFMNIHWLRYRHWCTDDKQLLEPRSNGN